MKEWLVESWAMMVAMGPYLLLGLLVSGAIYAWIPGTWIRRHLSGRGAGPVFKAALLGVPLPLCSCGVIPVASHLRRTGAGRGATMSFLISTPTSGVDSILATWSMLGPVFAFLRAIVSGAAGVVAGLLTDRLALPGSGRSATESGVPVQLRDRSRPGLSAGIRIAFQYAFGDLAGDIAKWVVVGVVAGGAIAAFLPDGFLGGLSGVWAYLGALAVGMPLYVCAMGAIPIAAALVGKGFSLGAAMVFLIAGPATNVATIAFVTGEFGRRALVLYLAVIGAFSVLAGLFLDWTVGNLGLSAMHHQHGGGMDSVWLGQTSASVLALVFAWHLIRRVRLRPRKKETGDMKDQTMLSIPSISCRNCAMHVERTLKAIPGVGDIEVDVAGKSVRFTGAVDMELVKLRLGEEGYPPA